MQIKKELYSYYENHNNLNPLNIIYLSTNDDYLMAEEYNKCYKTIALGTTVINLIISLIIYISFDFSSNQFQFVQEDYDMSYFDIYLGIDGLSVYFVLLTTIIMPIALLSN